MTDPAARLNGLTIPITVIISLAVQSMSLLWWGYGLVQEIHANTSRTAFIEEVVKHNKQLITNIITTAEALKTPTADILHRVEQIEHRLKQLEDQHRKPTPQRSR